MKSDIYQNIGTHVHITARTGDTEESIHGFLKTVEQRPYGRVGTQPSKRQAWASCAVHACSLSTREAEAEAAEELILYRKTLPQKQADTTNRADWPAGCLFANHHSYFLQLLLYRTQHLCPLLAPRTTSPPFHLSQNSESVTHHFLTVL